MKKLYRKKNVQRLMVKYQRKRYESLYYKQYRIDSVVIRIHSCLNPKWTLAKNLEKNDSIISVAVRSLFSINGNVIRSDELMCNREVEKISPVSKKTETIILFHRIVEHLRKKEPDAHFDNLGIVEASIIQDNNHNSFYFRHEDYDYSLNAKDILDIRNNAYFINLKGLYKKHLFSVDLIEYNMTRFEAYHIMTKGRFVKSHMDESWKDGEFLRIGIAPKVERCRWSQAQNRIVVLLGDYFPSLKYNDESFYVCDKYGSSRLHKAKTLREKMRKAERERLIAIYDIKKQHHNYTDGTNPLNSFQDGNSSKERR